MFHESEIIEKSLTVFKERSVEQRQQAGLPERVAAVHQFITAALKTAFVAHLPAGHPALEITRRTKINDMVRFFCKEMFS